MGPTGWQGTYSLSPPAWAARANRLVQLCLRRWQSSCSSNWQGKARRSRLLSQRVGCDVRGWGYFPCAPAIPSSHAYGVERPLSQSANPCLRPTPDGQGFEKQTFKFGIMSAALLAYPRGCASQPCGQRDSGTNYVSRSQLRIPRTIGASDSNACGVQAVTKSSLSSSIL